jgi:hypothetical protein
LSNRKYSKLFVACFIFILEPHKVSSGFPATFACSTSKIGAVLAELWKILTECPERLPWHNYQLKIEMLRNLLILN